MIVVGKFQTIDKQSGAVIEDGNSAIDTSKYDVSENTNEIILSDDKTITRIKKSSLITIK